MKKLKYWWFTRVVARGVQRNQNECIYMLVPRIVQQQFVAGVPAAQINKWLSLVGYKTIKGYSRNADGTYTIFHEWPSAERREQLDRPITRVV